MHTLGNVGQFENAALTGFVSALKNFFFGNDDVTGLPPSAPHLQPEPAVRHGQPLTTTTASNNCFVLLLLRTISLTSCLYPPTATGSKH